MGRDFWKFLVATNPQFYWMAKSLGGEAKAGADEAMEMLIPVALIGIIIFIIGGGIYLLLNH